MEISTGITGVLSALVGIPALIVVLINVLKAAGVVKDGQAAGWSQNINAVVYIVLFGMAQFGFATNLAAIDTIAGTLAELGPGILAMISIGHKLSGYLHDGFRGLPLIGKSHS